MYNTPWIERPSNSQRETPPEEAALRETYIAAQKVAYQLVCASNQLARVESPDVTTLAGVLREAVHKPEKDRANAIKAAHYIVLHRQADYISTLAYFQEYHSAWQGMRATLVEQLSAVAVPKEEPRLHLHTTRYVDVDLDLNCESVAALIDECDAAVAEALDRHYSRPTQKHAEAGFQKVFDALVAEVTGQSWVFNARLSCHANQSVDILRDLPVDRISSSHLPAQYAKSFALDAARDAFERVFCYDTTTTCRDFQENTRGSFNDTQLSESLLAATDVDSMQRIEQQRDAKLRSYGRKRRAVRNLVDTCQALFVQVAELLPEAVAEAAAIEDETMRRRAQNLCLFAARRLKENLKFIRQCDGWVSSLDHSYQDVSAAVDRGHQALVERIKSKQINRPTARRCEPYMG